jgi:hypothetical protein
MSQISIGAQAFLKFPSQQNLFDLLGELEFSSTLVFHRIASRQAAA